MSDLEDSDHEDVEDEDVESDKDEKEPEVKPTLGTQLITEYINSDEEEEEEEEEDEDEEEDALEEDALEEDALEENNALPALSNDPTLEYASSKSADPSQISPVNSDIESEDDDYLQKFDVEARDSYVSKVHPECFTGNSIEIESLTKIIRDNNNNIVDDKHKTNPFLTKYERTKVLGQRAKQLNMGHKPFVSVPPNIIDGYLIAQLELKEKKIPIIIRRPLPGGKSEYWKLRDLEII